MNYLNGNSLYITLCVRTDTKNDLRRLIQYNVKSAVTKDYTYPFRIRDGYGGSKLCLKLF